MTGPEIDDNRQGTDELRRIALHEAGHGLMAYLLRRRVEVMSCRPGAHFGGITFHAPYTLPPAVVDELARDLGPVITLNARARRALETPLWIALAGRAAEELLAPRSGYLGRNVDGDAADRAAAALAGLPPETRLDLEAWEASSEPLPSDDESSAAYAGVLTRYEAAEYLRWARAAVRRHLAERGAELDAIAMALERNVVLAGGQMRRILADLQRRKEGPR